MAKTKKQTAQEKAIQALKDALKLQTDLANKQYETTKSQLDAIAAQQKAENERNMGGDITAMQNDVDKSMLARGMTRSTVPVTLSNDNETKIRSKYADTAAQLLNEYNTNIGNAALSRDNAISTANGNYASAFANIMMQKSGGGGTPKPTFPTPPKTKELTAQQAHDKVVKDSGLSESEYNRNSALSQIQDSNIRRSLMTMLGYSGPTSNPTKKSAGAAVRYTPNRTYAKILS